MRVIAIDGPAGVGKSSVAKLVAEKLGYIYIDTGAMYRAVTYKALQNGIPVSDHAKLSSLAKSISINFEHREDGQHIFCDGEDVTVQIRSPEVTKLVSQISAIPGVRRSLVEIQRKIGSAGGVVMEGRDIGTVVFPDAKVKIFLTASAEERARRRARELSQAGISVDIEKVASDIRERDLLDSSRSESPLKQAKDAVLIDTDHLTIEDVAAKIIQIHNEKLSVDVL